MSIEERNYWMDGRVLSSMRNKAYKVISSTSSESVVELSESLLESLIDDEILPGDHDGRLRGRTNYEVCQMCRGSGSHVNPSIDSSGINCDDFDDDPDFFEAYKRGDYNVTCYECGGLRVVPEIQFDKKIAEAIERWVRDENDYVRTCAMERAMGC